MRTWAGIWVVLVVTALVLTGCLGIKTLPVSHPAAPTLFVDYQRTGGIAGVNDRLVIFDNGVTLVSSRTTSREILLNQSDLEQISTVFDSSTVPDARRELHLPPRGSGLHAVQYQLSGQDGQYRRYCNTSRTGAGDCGD